MNIQELLKTKPHNTHYLNRYYKFIRWCEYTNKNMCSSVYVEGHHICPKANDLFPEYANITYNKWNYVYLTARQHILAHIILWKTYGGSQSSAADCMLGNFNSKTNKKLSMRVVPTATRIRYLAKLREAAARNRSQYTIGKSTYKDSDGNKFFLDINSPLIKEQNLVGNVSGRIHSEESKQAMRDTKYPNRKIILYFLNNEISVKQFSQEFSDFISQGWSSTKSNDDYIYCKELGDQLNSKFWTGRARYATSDGIYHGAYLHTDKIIQELNLILYRTEAQIEQNLSRTILATESRLGSNIYNNGKEEKFLFEPIDSSWVLGRLARSVEWETNRVNAVFHKVLGAETWNDGERNYFFKPGDEIPTYMTKGMKFRDNTTYYYVKDTDVVMFLGKHTAPSGFEPIKVRSALAILERNLDKSIVLESIEDAKNLISTCVLPTGRLNSNKYRKYKHHIPKFRELLGIDQTIDDISTIYCLINDVMPSSCKVCAQQVNLSSKKDEFLKYCSVDCWTTYKTGKTWKRHVNRIEGSRVV